MAFVDTELRPAGEVQQKVGRIKLSEAIRKCGYGFPMDYSDCVIGRAYRFLTGRDLVHDADEYEADRESFKYNEFAARAFGVPDDIALKAEQMCYHRAHTSDEIADWLAAQGL